ncbi:MAG: YqeG family HAD IIIA-type phosphatase [Coriobacteriales bacterium]|jgi:HAD superfamily phosphatase (TIGR01668 family)|nr:YqeG family HAD IIIA-type phosphatase [Coriobacteriales bacterium]
MPFLTPDDYLGSVERIDPSALVEQGFGIVLLDIDNTLVPRDTRRLPAGVARWVARLREEGLRVCLLSNNWHRVVFDYARELDLPLVHRAMKPAPFAYMRALRKMGRRRGEKVVCVGDQIVTDVWGAHLLGLKAILVEPQATKDLWYTQLFRRFERRLMHGRRPRV